MKNKTESWKVETMPEKKNETQTIELTQEEANALYQICDVALKAVGIEALGPAATILLKLQKKPDEEVEEIERH